MFRSSKNCRARAATLNLSRSPCVSPGDWALPDGRIARAYKSATSSEPSFSYPEKDGPCANASPRRRRPRRLSEHSAGGAGDRLKADAQHQLTGHKEMVALYDRSKAAIIRN